jgi:glycosyltransferase involved in cell wall biosynthesis
MMPTSIALLSTYPPTQCGLATFTAALFEQLDLSPGRVGIIRVIDKETKTPDGGDVVAHLVSGCRTSAHDAVRAMNSYGTVVVQHEYGIYGGPDGIDVLEVVDALTVPIIVVLHTVLEDPTARQRHILERLVGSADAVVTMAETARRRLVEQHAVDPARIVVIPHGAIDHRTLRRPRVANSRPEILTWGLLGPGKGIEWAIDAMTGMRDLMPRYLVVGKTHPKVLSREGESYRNALADRVDTRGVADIVDIDGTYLSVPELGALIERADVVLLPYDSADQVTSGVLIEAVAAGRPVVSTAFPHAVELLADGAGLVVAQQDPAAMAQALRRVLTEPGLGEAMAAQAASQAPGLVWGSVAQRYRLLAGNVAAEHLVIAS